MWSKPNERKLHGGSARGTRGDQRRRGARLRRWKRSGCRDGHRVEPPGLLRWSATTEVEAQNRSGERPQNRHDLGVGEAKGCRPETER